MIPISAVHLDPEVERTVLAVLRSGQIAEGSKVAEFERAFAELCEVPHAVAVNNGSTALTVVLYGPGIGPGDTKLTGVLIPLHLFGQTADTTPYGEHPLVVPGDAPVVAGVAGKCLSLPVHAALMPDDVEGVTDAVRDVL